jgi:hypothetical protein
VCRAENITVSYDIITFKSGSLNLLEPSGPVQAYKGITLLYMYLNVSTLLSDHSVTVLKTEILLTFMLTSLHGIQVQYYTKDYCINFLCRVH